MALMLMLYPCILQFHDQGACPETGNRWDCRPKTQDVAEHSYSFADYTFLCLSFIIENDSS